MLALIYGPQILVGLQQKGRDGSQKWQRKESILQSPGNEGRSLDLGLEDGSGAGVFGNHLVLSDKHSGLRSKHRRNDWSNVNSNGQKGSQRIFNLEKKSKADSSEICADFSSS